jgi:hypothetical protein
LQHFFLLQATSLRREPSPTELFIETHVRSEDRQRGGAIVHRQPHLTLCGMFVQPFYFVSYYFLELNMMISFLIFRRHIIVDKGEIRERSFDPPEFVDEDKIIWWTR